MYFFFFQAEDGIRDKLVTGVQTCALPILLVMSRLPLMTSTRSSGSSRSTVRGTAIGSTPTRISAGAINAPTRSEERRVGKSVDLGGRRIIKKKKEDEE